MFSVVIGVSNANKMKLLGSKRSVALQTTIIATDGNANYMHKMLKKAIGALFDRQVTCHLIGGQTQGFAAHRG